MAYEYVTSLRRYRDIDTGQFVAREKVLEYTQSLIDAGSDAGGILADQFNSGALSPDDLILSMRDELKSSFIQEYVLGRGGRDLMSKRDWGHVGAMIKPQYSLLEGFRADLKAGILSPDQISARARQYFGATREGYERGNSAAHGVYDLPAYPADGSSICMNGDACQWLFDVLDGDGNINCYWVIEPSAEHCETCLERSQEWSPIEIRGGEIQPFKEIHTHAHPHPQEGNIPRRGWYYVSVIQEGKLTRIYYEPYAA